MRIISAVSTAPQDYVRTEIELALERKVPLIPVLLPGVAMPRADDLPASIAPLVYRNAVTVDPGGSFRMHMDRLIRGLEHLFATLAATAKTAQAADLPSKQEPSGETRRPASVHKPPVRSVSDARPISAKSARSSGTELERFLAEIDDPDTLPRRRLEIGDHHAELGDTRPGVGPDANGVPDSDWVEVPGGGSLFGEEKERKDLDTFWIAKYPIANMQFQPFVDDGGYREERWRRDLKRPEPRDSRWPQGNRPRTDMANQQVRATVQKGNGEEIGAAGHPESAVIRHGVMVAHCHMVAVRPPSGLRRTRRRGLASSGATSCGVAPYGLSRSWNRAHKIDPSHCPPSASLYNESMCTTGLDCAHTPPTL